MHPKPPSDRHTKSEGKQYWSRISRPNIGKLGSRLKIHNETDKWGSNDEMSPASFLMPGVRNGEELELVSGLPFEVKRGKNDLLLTIVNYIHTN